MAKHHFVIFYVFLVLIVSTISLESDASDDGDTKLHIIYMGSLPKGGSYYPNTHHINILQQVIGTNDPKKHLVISYNKSFNGFAAWINDEQREKLCDMEGVISVFPSRKYQTQTTRSWDFLGFQQSVKRNENIESDVVVGVFDTGIWPESKSFNDDGIGPIPNKWRGHCAGGSNFTCNKKIIGARVYHLAGGGDMSARDIEGHGTHTASTIAGREVNGASFYGLAEGTARGGIPSARIASYKICHPTQGCTGADILAAFDDSIADGVDIISLSVGPQFPADFKNDEVAIGSFHAMEKGILTVQSAGNEGPSEYSVVSVAPWLLTVGASTIDRRFIDKLILGNGKTLIGNSINSFELNGTKFPIAVKTSRKPCKDATEGCDCVDRDLVEGKIVLCPKFGFDDNAYEQGAIGSITVTAEGLSDVSFVTAIPSVNLNYEDYVRACAYANSTKHPLAAILKSETIKDLGAPQVASFSSRGPNIKVPEILKPDISAPGLDILAGFSPAVSPSGKEVDKRRSDYNIISGTSMACPHVSAAAGYVKTFHPDWSPAAIKSAIMTTAQPMNGKYDLAGEFSYGTGNVNPQQAINPGLVYDISMDDYVEMLCNYGYVAKDIKLIAGGNATCHAPSRRSLVKNLNYPALVAQVQPLKPFTVKFIRTVTNVGFPRSRYVASISRKSNIKITVEPNVLSFKSLNEEKSFVVTVVGGAKEKGVVLSSSLVWSDGTHHVKSPIIVL